MTEGGTVDNGVGGLGQYIREEIQDLKKAFNDFTDQIRATTGDHAIRIAKLEMRADQLDRNLDEERRKREKGVEEATAGRRWNVGTWIAAIAVVVAVAAIIVSIVRGA